MKKLLILMLFLSQSVFAVETPGSVWSSTGNAPVEPDNVSSALHVDQGIVVGHIGKTTQVIPYAAVNVIKDTQGLPWNNKAGAEVGVKLTKSFDHGSVTLAGAYGVERQYRTIPDEAAAGFMVSATGWFGYQLLNKIQTPGSIWFSVGNTALTDDTNVIGMARLEQGLTIFESNSAPIDVVGWAQVGADSIKRPWNNRSTVGGGLRVSLPWNDGVASLTGGYECTTSPTEDLRLCGPTVRLNIWVGWK